jgi:hypothetical protein
LMSLFRKEGHEGDLFKWGTRGRLRRVSKDKLR